VCVCVCVCFFFFYQAFLLAEGGCLSMLSWILLIWNIPRSWRFFCYLFWHVSGILLMVWNALWKNIDDQLRERNYLPSQKLQDQVVIMSRWLLGEPICEWIKECKPWLTAGLHANSTLSSHSALAASTRSTESWLTLALFHVGLVLFVRSLCPEQQGPGGGYLSAACLNKKRFKWH
jgi:hypothetical protein